MCEKSFLTAYLWYTGKLDENHFSKEKINEMKKRFNEKRDKPLFIFPKC